MSRAAGLDLGEYTGGSLLAGLRVLRAKFATDARRQVALLLLPHRFSDMVDLTRPGGHWLWPLGDAGVALVVKRAGDGLTILDHAFATDGAASRLLTVQSELADEGPCPEGFYDKEWAILCSRHSIKTAPDLQAKIDVMRRHYINLCLRDIFTCALSSTA